MVFPEPEAGTTSRSLGHNRDFLTKSGNTEGELSDVTRVQEKNFQEKKKNVKEILCFLPSFLPFFHSTISLYRGKSMWTLQLGKGNLQKSTTKQRAEQSRSDECTR